VTRVLIAQDRLHGLEVDEQQIVCRSAVFVRPRFVPNNDVLLLLGCHVDEDGWPTADSAGRTSVPGVWVAGNVANPRAQVITAAGEGSTVAIALNAELVDQDVQQAVHRRRNIRST
jgi:thioredoxin reductase